MSSTHASMCFIFTEIVNSSFLWQLESTLKLMLKVDINAIKNISKLPSNDPSEASVETAANADFLK